MDALIHNLYATLHGRRRPEDVAKVIMAHRPEVYTGRARTLLQNAARYGYFGTSMSSEFEAAVWCEKQLKVAYDIFPEVERPANPSDPDEVQAYLGRLCASIMLNPGGDFFQREHRERRKALGVKHVGHRAYNKRVRFIRRMEEKLPARLHNRTMRDLAHIAKSRLVTRITKDMFEKDADSACFIAYMAARLNQRSLFTSGPQVRAYDEVADALFHRLNPKTASWLAIAYVHPDPAVLKHLSEEEKGRLLGAWFEVMTTASNVLADQATDPGLDLVELVVRRGNDSSTWNEAAGAFNKARDGWVNTLYALGMEIVLDKFAPPKCLRLMAADVVYWHRQTNGLDPATFVWQQLPKPWAVMQGTESCTRADIEAACQKQGVSSDGWVKPRPKTVAPFSPTPELVHGVVVSSPALAAALRKSGCFSGYGVTGPVPEFSKNQVGDTMVVS